MNHDQKFRNIQFGAGSLHDLRVYRNSSLTTYVEEVYDYHVVADAAFSGKMNIKITLLTNRQLLSSEESCNLCLQRVVVQKAL